MKPEFDKWGTRTRSKVKADFSKLGDDRRSASALPRNMFCYMDVSAGIAIWHHAGESNLRGAPIEYLLTNRVELDDFDVDSVRLLSDLLASLPVQRGILTRKKIMRTAPRADATKH